MTGNNDDNGFWFNSSDTVRACSTDYVRTGSRRCPADAHATATPNHATPTVPLPRRATPTVRVGGHTWETCQGPQVGCDVGTSEHKPQCQTEGLTNFKVSVWVLPHLQPLRS